MSRASAIRQTKETCRRIQISCGMYHPFAFLFEHLRFQASVHAGHIYLECCKNGHRGLSFRQEKASYPFHQQDLIRRLI